MKALDCILARYHLDPSGPLPLRIPDTRHGGLTRLWHDLGYTVGAEIGVERGHFSKEICRDNPGVHLYGVDPWRVYAEYPDHKDQSQMDWCYRDATRRLAPHDVELIRETSLDAAKRFALESLDFVFIDANHAEPFVRADLDAWAPLVRVGGIVAGHDYTPGGEQHPPLVYGVIEAVNAYVAQHQIKPWFLWTHDKCPSWMWIKT